jgi:hypothetical protein
VGPQDTDMVPFRLGKSPHSFQRVLDTCVLVATLSPRPLALEEIAEQVCEWELGESEGLGLCPLVPNPGSPWSRNVAFS